MADAGSDPNFQTPYDLRIASKKVGWGLAKLVAAQATAPAAIVAFQTVAEKLKPLGITVIIDEKILSQALPGLIFMVLIALHDWAKVKTKKEWL